MGIGHPGVKSEVANWVLKKPSPDQRTLIEDSIVHSLKAYPAMLAGEMDKATLLIHTTKPPRPKPPALQKTERRGRVMGNNGPSHPFRSIAIIFIASCA